MSLTTRYNNPDEVHEEIVEPEVVRLWPAVRETLVVMIKHAGSIVQNVAIYLPKRDHRLQRMAQRMFCRNEDSDNKRQRAPADLMAFCQRLSTLAV